MPAMTLRLTILTLALTGCNESFQAGKSDFSSPDESVSEETPSVCSSTVRTIAPISDGQSNFYFRDDIIFSTSEGAETAEILLETEDGELIEGSTWVDEHVEEGEDLRVVFTPDLPLNPGTGYTATFEHCGGSPSVDFRTSTLGSPVENIEALTGGTYTMDLSKARVVKPGNTAQALLTLVDNHLAMQINSSSNDTLDVTIAATDSESGLQDTCIPSLHANMPNNFAAKPTFMVGPVDVPFTLAGYTVQLYDATAAATFAADGSFFAGGTIAGSMDARDVVEALAGRGVLPTESPDALCEIIGNAKLPCTPCADGEPYCLYLEVRDVLGEREFKELETVEQSQCHEECAKSCDNMECEAADDFPVCSL